jgi:hypothetical protein
VYSKAPAMWCPRCDMIQAFIFEVTQDGVELGWKQHRTMNALPVIARESAIVRLHSLKFGHRKHTDASLRLPTGSKLLKLGRRLPVAYSNVLSQTMYNDESWFRCSAIRFACCLTPPPCVNRSRTSTPTKMRIVRRHTLNGMTANFIMYDVSIKQHYQ